MTPEEAQNFAEDDEDPQEIFARLETATQIRQGLDYIRGTYGCQPLKSEPGWYGRAKP